MEPRFIIRTAISEELIRLMSRQACKSPRALLMRLILIAVGIWELHTLIPLLYDVLMVYSASGELYLSSLLTYGIFCLFFLLAIVYAIFLMPLRIRRQFRKAYKAQMGEVIVHTFYDDHCTCEYTGSFSSMQYDLIKFIQEDRDWFIMHRTTAGASVILPKSAFTLGTSEDFRTFLEREKGKSFKPVR